MEQALRQWLNDQDERAIDDAFFDNGCPHFFAVDWGEDDADIVQYCADCLGDQSVRAEWRGDSLVIIRGDNETTVPLANDAGDRDVTIRALNDVLQPDYEIRWLVSSHGSDTAGFADSRCCRLLIGNHWTSNCLKPSTRTSSSWHYCQTYSPK